MSQTHSTRAAVERFVSPPWHAPLDPAAAISAMPESAQVRGMLIAPMLHDAKKRRVSWPLPRERYIAFQLYPLREHAAMLVQTSSDLYPDRSLRQGLRKLGRAAAATFGASTVGKVTLGAAEGVHDIIAAFAKGYELTLQPGRASIEDSSERSVVVRVEDVHYFLDSHHVGSFEGAMKRAGVQGQVSIARSGDASADFLLQW